MEFWSNYSDLTRPHPNWWLNKGNPLISGKPRLVKYYNLAYNGMCFQGFVAVAHMTGHVSRNFCFTIFQVTLDAFQGVAWLIWLNGRSGEPIDPVRMRVGEEKQSTHVFVFKGRGRP